jgi:acetyl-CoA synthase
MSKLIAFAAIQGGYKVVAQVEGELEKALQTYDAATKIGFPNTAYYLPVIYSLTGLKCETLEDLKKPMAFARGLLPPHIRLKNWLPYLGPLLDAGMAGIISYDVKEALRRSGY